MKLDDRIKDLGENVYIVCGKVIKVVPGVIDLDTKDGQDCLINKGEHLYESETEPRPYGPLNVAIVRQRVVTSKGLLHVMGFCHMSYLPDSVKEKLRKEFPEYAEDI